MILLRKSEQCTEVFPHCQKEEEGEEEEEKEATKSVVQTFAVVNTHLRQCSGHRALLNSDFYQKLPHTQCPYAQEPKMMCQIYCINPTLIPLIMITLWITLIIMLQSIVLFCSHHPSEHSWRLCTLLPHMGSYCVGLDKMSHECFIRSGSGEFVGPCWQL